MEFEEFEWFSVKIFTVNIPGNSRWVTYDGIFVSTLEQFSVIP